MLNSSHISRLLIAATTVLLPLDDHLPQMGGRSFLFVLFAVVGLWAILHASRQLIRVLVHPLTLVAGGFLAMAFLLESLHRSPQYSDLLHTALMLAGAIALASLCRDRAGVRVLCYSLVLGGIVLSVLLVQSMYSIIEMAGAGRAGAQLARAAIDSTRTVVGDLNALSCYAALSAAMSLHLALTPGSLFRRLLALGAFVFCTVAAFLPLSRSGVVILAISCLVALQGHGGIRPRNMIAVAAMAIALLVFVPEAAFGRLEFSANDGRGTIYLGLLRSLGEYAFAGVGAGEYWNGWASSRGIVSGDGAMGAHNAFLQSLVYWGFLGVMGLLAVVWVGARCVPRTRRGDEIATAARMLAFGGLVWLMLVHTMWDKQFSLVLAVLISVDLLGREPLPQFFEVRPRRFAAAAAQGGHG